jgi:hypothetical protein
MREDLLHFGVMAPIVASVLALGLMLGWSDGVLGVGVLGAIGVGLFVGDSVAARLRGDDRNRPVRSERAARA